MEDYMVLIHHSGKWVDNRFEDYTAVGMFLPFSSNLQILRSSICRTLNLDENAEDVVVRYQSKPGSSPIDINDELQLRFYLSLKSRASDPTDYPLCVSSVRKEIVVSGGVDQCELVELNTIFPESDDDVEDGNSMYLRHIAGQTLQEFRRAASVNRTVDIEDESVISNYRIEKLEVGQIFKDKQVLKDAIVYLARKEEFTYKTKKSCPLQYWIGCVDEECSWLMKASKKINFGKFVVREYVPNHTCPIDVRCGPKVHLNRNVIGKALKHNFYQHKRQYMPNDIKWDVRRKFGEEITYQKAWRARETAIQMIVGTPKESYNLLPSLLHVMRTVNPGSFVDYKTDNEGRFEYMFFALAATIKGWQHCKPILVVDATFLRSCYGGTLMSAVGQDALGMLYPLGFGVVDGENDASWHWFFHNFRAAYGEREGLVVVSDRHQSIEKASRLVFPGAPHCVCMVHLLQNLKTKFKTNNEELAKYFRKTCKAYSIEKFEDNMMHLKNLHKRIPSYLEEVGYEKWSMLHSPMPRYNVLTTNIAESLNAVNKEAKHLPISALIEYLLDMMLDLFNENRNIALGTFTHLASEWERRLEKRYHYASRMEVKLMGGMIAKVSVDGNISIVDLDKRTCTCNGFQIDEVPCAHALAYIKKFGLITYDYCSQYYTKKNMLHAYEELVHPILNKDTWIIPTEVSERMVHPPVVKIRAGRSKKKRHPHPLEKHGKGNSRCSVCRGKNHNRRTCGGACN